jgi:hypothetical protein
MCIQRRGYGEDGIQRTRRARRVRLLRTAALALFVCAFARPAAAACSGSSPNRTAASASRTDVNDCVTAASSGDTINVPAGTANWGSPIALPSNKDLTLAGATVISCTGGSSSDNPVSCSAANNTNITCGGGCVTINLAATHRITGFTFLGITDSAGILFDGNQSLSKHFRVDHNRLVSSGWSRLNISGDSNAVHPQGVVDHNIIVNISWTHYGTDHQWDDSCTTCQHQLWAQTTTLGGGTAVTSIEANHFQHTSANTNSIDGNHGSRSMFRFNNITSGRHTAEVHGMQGQNRGPQRSEIYHNAASNLTGFSGTVFFRGGSGVIFGNRQSNAFSFGVLFTNDRSELDDPVETVGDCDGTHSGVDQNSGQRGWRCRDQVGVIGDNVQWQHSPFGAWNQKLAPVYVWDNLTGASQMDVEVDTAGDADVHIQANRDFYNYTTSFNGTSGVGSGPIASRPSTCTTGVGYWATNQGEWNSLEAGPDGQLYKCTATNTWSLYYTPYQYPHPWTVSGATAPAPPTNLRIVGGLLFSVPWIVGLFVVQRRQGRGSR